MKKRQLLFPALMSAIVLGACGSQENQKNETVSMTASNPFSTASTLLYETPDFSKIKNEDFKPALEEGIKQQLAEIDSIANNTAAPDFENVFVALEKSGRLLERVSNVLNLLTGANTNDTLQALQEEIAPKLAAKTDAIFLNEKLFARVEVVYNKREALKLDAESKRLTEYYYQKFVLAGAKLSAEDKAALKKLNEEEATLSAQYSNKLLNAAKTGALVIDKEAGLDGVSASDKAAFAKDAADKKMEGKWLIPLQNTTQQPALQSLTNRAVRERLFDAGWNRAERSDSNDTRATILRIAAIRAQKAKLMGFANFAEWQLKDQMAQSPAAVDKFFAQLVPSCIAKAEMEAKEIQALIDQQKAGISLAAYDWDYYAEQVRQAKYNLDQKEVAPYFELNKVLTDGVFYAATQLYGITFKERKDLPVYQADVRVFEVFDEAGKSFALFYCDYFKRDNKSGGAWMSNLVNQSTLLGTQPVIYNVCNFTKPAPGQPALISFDDVTTMFHEFGHALHGLFASQQYPSISGANTARDFVEFPSQFNEHWALYPSVLNHYAVHYKTGAAIPAALVQKIKNAATFNTGYSLTEQLAAASLDMQWHELAAADKVDNVDSFETKALYSKGLRWQRYRPVTVVLISCISGPTGYAAGYYAYQWTKMLEEDAYAWFEENGGLTRANGQRFRDLVLSRGNTEDYNAMFLKFRGHAPSIAPLQKALGLPGGK